MEEYKSNSHKSLAVASKVDKVVTGSVKTKKKNEMQKLVDIFIPEDLKSIKSFIVMEVIIPSVKKAISDIVTSGINLVLYGDGANGSKPSAAYHDTYKKLIFYSRTDTEAVLSAMDGMIGRNGKVSIADLYDLANVTDEGGRVSDYGWTDIRDAMTVRIKEGYVLRLPKAKLLK